MNKETKEKLMGVLGGIAGILIVSVVFGTTIGLAAAACKFVARLLGV